ncbi:hypothetical protein [uncultured Brachyspira sp.]|uniref:hypothetical protein n=1 Tax=uncultured Brachyspira sp. TaxID=221953 RepID=UPI0026323FFF|nr:hypothetical protein [uncultured Brachyspira sp.]
MKKIIIFLFLFILLFSLFCYAQRENNNTDTYQDYILYKYPNYIDYYPKLLGFFFPSETSSNLNNIFTMNRYKGMSYTLHKSLPNDPEAVKLWKEWGIMK